MGLSFLVHAQLDISGPHETWQSKGTKSRSQPYLPPMVLTEQKLVKDFQGFISYQVNVTSQGENRLNDAANEPSLAVNPLNPQQIAIGWRQFDNINSDFRQAGVAYSDDGGLTWHNNGPLEPGIFRSDPVLSADADGTFFYQSLRVLETNGRPGLQDDDLFRVDQWRSNNGGQSWFDKTDVMGGDKSWFVIDTSEDSTQGNIYAAWNLAGNNYYPDSFNYSVDNGQTYTTPVSIPKSPVYSTLALGPEGEVYVAGVWGEGNLNDLYLVKSQNPLSVMFPDFSQVTALDLNGAMAVGGINPVGLLGQMWVAVDKSNRHTHGRVYVLSSIDVDGLDPLDIQFIVSHDGGKTFSPPKTINDDGVINNWQWFGTMSVAPNGRIDVIWLDTRNDTASVLNKNLSQLFYSYSYDGGQHFSVNQPISAPFYHYLGYPVQRKMGDYIDMVSDNQGAHIAYTATFTGGQDVYYLHVQPAAFEENPYFPGHELDSIWHHPEVPRQGIFSRTLVANPDSVSPQLIQYEAVFTETPSGQPTWFVLEAGHPIEDDQVVFPILYPTGDLSSHSAALSIIGLATKSRVYDDQGELIPDQMNYEFDMREERLAEVAELAGDTGYFDADFYRNNPFYSQHKSITLDQLVTGEQPRHTACSLQGLPLINNSEVAEGRVSMVFNRNNKNIQFAGDFGYRKALDENNQLQIVLDDHGLAIPEWYVMETVEGDVVNDDITAHVRYTSQGGNGFFVVGAPDPGVVGGEIEQVKRLNDSQIETTQENGAQEILSIMAYGSYCGRDLTVN
jgi:hypothetical protein